jgi:antitoxin MazE
MRSELRKMGNSTGMIVPKVMLGEWGIESGTKLDLVLENGVLMVHPVRRVREGWAEAAAAVAAAEEDPDEDAWASFGNDGDDDLQW